MTTCELAIDRLGIRIPTNVIGKNDLPVMADAITGRLAKLQRDCLIRGKKAIGNRYAQMAIGRPFL